jgi:hypothetical protein
MTTSDNLIAWRGQRARQGLAEEVRDEPTIQRIARLASGHQPSRSDVGDPIARGVTP